MRLRSLLIVLSLMLGTIMGATTSAQAVTAPGNILPPFDAGQTWNVCQGYGGGPTHTGTSQYGLDLTGAGCDNSAAGRTVRAPVSGTVYYYQPAYGNMCINLPDGRSLTLTHIDSSITSGTVNAGQAVGTVAAPNQRGNAGVAHIHFQLWATPGCYGNPGIPFDADHGARICGAPNLTASGPNAGNNGIWSNTSFTGRECDSGSGPGTSGVGTRLLGDVNGDGKDDSVVMFRDTGTAMVALSTGTGFAAPVSWAYGRTPHATKYFLADVEGDGRDDLIAAFLDVGQWYVSLSSGSGFWTESSWAYGHGVGTHNQWMKDVSGDGKADIVTVDTNNGDWWVSVSSGTGFWSPTRWTFGHGAGSQSQQVADFTGDGKADAAVYFTSNGKWYVAASNGSGFNGYYEWSAGHGMSSDKRLTGDTNGDGKADAAYFFASNGHWDVGTSSGSGFWSPTAWAHSHGIGTYEQFLADVEGDGRADIVTFDRVNGDWWVSLSSGSGFWSPVQWITGHGANS
jgi:hypothetical protein